MASSLKNEHTRHTHVDMRDVHLIELCNRYLSGHTDMNVLKSATFTFVTENCEELTVLSFSKIHGGNGGYGNHSTRKDPQLCIEMNIIPILP